MIDMSAYKKLHPTSSLEDHIGSEKMARDDPPDGDFLLLLPPKIKGYNLRRKKWRMWESSSFENQLMLRHVYV
jgi:hypothetical protein